MPPKDKYTDPELRDQVKEEIKQSDKGGAPGQWSARKAQMMAQEYKKRGGTYTTDKSQQDESQKNLEKWTEEEWQTKDGEGEARKEDGATKRYLPKKAWEKMSKNEKEQTDQKKQEESIEGNQFVSNTSKAKVKRKQANEEEHEDFEARKKVGKQENDVDDDEEDDEDDAAASDDDESDEAYHDAEEGDVDEVGEGESEGEPEDDDGEAEGGDEDDQQATVGQKRKAKNQSNGTPNKQQKQSKSGGNAPKGKIGSKHMPADAPAPQGSVDRLPKKGAQVTWKAMPGWVDGKVKEILTKNQNVNGKSVKASKDDPRIVLESNSSGKICVHKPDACYYE